MARTKRKASASPSSSAGVEEPRPGVAQLALPSIASRSPGKSRESKAEQMARMSTDGRGAKRRRRRSTNARGESTSAQDEVEERKPAVQLDLTLAALVQDDAEAETSPVESARRAAMERSREALRARLNLVSSPRSAASSSRPREIDSSTTFPDDMRASESSEHSRPGSASSMDDSSVVEEEQIPSEVLFVGPLPSAKTGEVGELLAERLSIPPPKSSLPFQRPSGDFVLEHRTAKAWLRVSRVSSGLHVLLAGDARHRWLSEIREAVHELGLLEAE